MCLNLKKATALFNDSNRKRHSLCLGDLCLFSSGKLVAEPGRDVEGDKDVDGVVLVGCQDEEDPKHVADPGECVQEVNLARRVLGDEEVEKRQRDRVPGEHVVAAGTNSL